MTQAIHYIDLLQWFMGDVAEVYGKINTYKHGGHIEVEDSATAVITFTSGAMATLEASTAVSPSLGVQLRVTGETGASASLTEFPEGSDGRVDLWAVGETISTEPAHPEGIHPNVDLATINGQLIPHHTTPGPRFRSGPPGRHGTGHHRPGRHQGAADPAGRLRIVAGPGSRCASPRRSPKYWHRRAPGCSRWHRSRRYGPARQPN